METQSHNGMAQELVFVQAGIGGGGEGGELAASAALG